MHRKKNFNTKERESNGHGKGKRFDKGERERAMARERACAPLGHLTIKWREKESMMAKEKEGFTNLQY
jgi:hypothetical protein